MWRICRDERKATGSAAGESMTSGDATGHSEEQRLESSKRKKKRGGRWKQRGTDDGKGAAVGQVKWRVPAGFYAALVTGPPCRYHWLPLPPFSPIPRLPVFRVPVFSQRLYVYIYTS